MGSGITAPWTTHAPLSCQPAGTRCLSLLVALALLPATWTLRELPPTSAATQLPRAGAVGSPDLLALPQAPSWTTTEVLVDARILPDGRVAVTVIRAVAFGATTETTMALDIPLDGAASIEVLEVGEPGRHYALSTEAAPRAYAVEHGDDGSALRWGVAAAAGETRRFIVTYLLEGAIDIDPRGDTLARTLLLPGTDAVASAVVRVSVPPTAQAIIIAAAERVPAGEAVAIEREGDTAVQTAPTALAAGEGIAVRVTWPTGAVAGTPREDNGAPGDDAGSGALAETPGAPAAGMPRPWAPQRDHRPALAIVLGLVGAVVAMGAVFGAALRVLARRAARMR